MSENPANSTIGDEMSPGGPVINWDRIIHKNVRTADNQAMGKVIAVPDDEESVIISSQSANDIYRVPRSMIAGFNGAEVQLGVTSDSMASFHVNDAGAYEAQPSDVITEGRRGVGEETGSSEETIPVIEERINVSKRKTTEEATIAKTPEKQQRSVEVPVTKERLVVERRKASAPSTTEKPVESEQEIRVPLKTEKVEVTKEPYVKEEVVVKKKPVTETKKITDTVQGEKVDVKDRTKGTTKKRK
jgi:uncharacterized protein (TIGR02271 family)